MASIYSKCSEACDRLMAGAATAHSPFFTELDVVNEAASASKGWNDEQFREAMRHANQVVGTKYRERKLSRFGPVKIPDMPEPDYARIGAKIVYAPADGPKVFETPNGNFKRMMVEHDRLSRQGRRLGTNRNDLMPWTEQELVSKRERETDPKRRVRELEANLRAAHTRVKALEAENERLRSHASSELVEAVAELVKTQMEHEDGATT